MTTPQVTDDRGGRLGYRRRVPAPPRRRPAPQTYATMRRAWGLFRAFRAEQSDPDRFYSLLASDSVRQLSAWADLDGRLVLDVGGGPGYFGAAFQAAGA